MQGCSSSKSGGSGTDSGSAGDAGSNSYATGSFSGTDSTGVAVSGTIPGSTLFVSTNTAKAQTSLYFYGSVVFSAPMNAAGAELTVSIGLPTPPVAGSYDGRSSNGTLTLPFGTSTIFFAESPDGGPPLGSWSMSLSSVTQSSQAGDPIDYAAHGTITAQMSDGHSGTGTLNLSF